MNWKRTFCQIKKPQRSAPATVSSFFHIKKKGAAEVWWPPVNAGVCSRITMDKTSIDKIILQSIPVADIINSTDTAAMIQMRKKEILEKYKIKQIPTGEKEGYFYTRINGRLCMKKNRDNVESEIIEAVLSGSKKASTVKAIYAALQKSEEGNLSSNTIFRDNRLFINYLHSIENKQITSLTTTGIAELLEQIAGPGIRQKEFNNVKSLLRKILRQAERQGLRVADIEKAFDLVHLGRNALQIPDRDALGQAYTLEQAKLIIQYCLEQPSYSRLAIALCLVTGLRVGEVIALQVSDINYITGKMPVCRMETKNRLERKYEIVPHCKTPQSVRYVFLSEDALNVLTRIMDFRKQNDCSSIWLFPGQDEGNLHFDGPEKSIWKLNRRLKMPYNCSMHDCRRTYASIAYLYGHIDLKRLQRQLGHKTPTQTWDYIKDIVDTADDAEAFNGYHITKTVTDRNTFFTDSKNAEGPETGTSAHTIEQGKRDSNPHERFWRPQY